MEAGPLGDNRHTFDQKMSNAPGFIPGPDAKVREVVGTSHAYLALAAPETTSLSDGDQTLGRTEFLYSEFF